MNVNKEMLIELVHSLINAEGSGEEQDQILNLLKDNVLDPDVSDYIYWNEDDLSAEEIVEKVLSYKPIQL